MPTTTTTGSSYSFHPRLPELPITERTARILWRDIIFLILGAVALFFVSFVEKNAADAVSEAVRQRMFCNIYTLTINGTPFLCLTIFLVP